MADKGIKNVIIKKDLLGKVTSSNARVVRFRLIAEDKNRKSAYSKIFITGSDAVIVGEGDVNPIGNSIFVNWSVGEGSTQLTYDIFAGFDGAIPTYRGSTSSQNYSFLKQGTQSVRVVVQVSTIDPKKFAEVTINGITTNHLDVYSETVSLV
jgi:hypothetical protein